MNRRIRRQMRLALAESRMKCDPEWRLARRSSGVRALARLADLAADDDESLERRAIDISRTVVSRHDAGVALEVGELVRHPAALARRVVRLALTRVAPGARLAAGHLEAVRRLAAAEKTYGRLDLPGVAVLKTGSILVCRQAGPIGPDGPVAFSHALTVPGSVEVPEAGVTIVARPPSKGETGPLEAAGPAITVQAASLAEPLTVRSRQPGDRFRPLGAPGRRKVQDLLVDRKVPRETRDRVPLVVDANGEIVWVAGVAPAHRCRVTAPETGVVILEMRNSQ
jgi:tRNA(Ile)-lysidine synthase